jgi:hypothetical protein
LLVALALVAAAVSLWGTAYGPATNEDSGGYLCGAQNLIEKGAFLMCGRDLPMVWFPPFYSFLLAGLDAIGLWRMEGARVLCAITFAAGTLLTGAILYESTVSLLVAILGELLFLTMGDIVTTYLYAMSEAPFVALLLLFIFWTWRALEDDRMRWLVLAGLAAAAAALTRYMGASLIVTGAIAIAWYDARPIPIRLRRAALFLLAGCVPVGAWMCRNLHLAGSLTSRRLGYYPLDAQQYPKAAYTVVRWFYPFSAAICTVIGAPVIIAVLLAFVLVAFWNPGKLPWLLAILALANAAIIVVSRLFADPYVVFAGRILVPILVMSVILTLWVAHSIFAQPTVSPRWRWGAVALALLFVMANTVRSRGILHDARTYGFELSTRYYRDSALIAWLSRLPPDTVIYTDEPEPIYFFGGRIADLLPMITDPNGEYPLASLAGEVSRMHDRLDDHTGIIVYFYRAHPHRRDNMADLVLMPAVYGLSMRPLFQNQDGVIYEIRAVANRPSRNPGSN